MQKANPAIHRFARFTLAAVCTISHAVAVARETSVDAGVEKYAKTCESAAKDCDRLVSEALGKSDPYWDNLNRAASASLQGCVVAAGDWDVCKNFVEAAANFPIERISLENREHAINFTISRGAELISLAMRDPGTIDRKKAETAIKVFSMTCARLEDHQSCGQIFTLAKMIKNENVIRETLALLKDRCSLSRSAKGGSPACTLYEEMRNDN